MLEVYFHQLHNSVRWTCDIDTYQELVWLYPIIHRLQRNGAKWRKIKRREPKR